MSMAALHYEFRVGHSTVSQILSDTMMAIYEVLSPMYLQEPQSDTLKSVSETFRAKCFLPNCIGALDGKHVRIQCPYKFGSQFYNYKSYFSLILLAACDANYKFIYVDVGAFGSESDGGVFAGSDLGKGIDTGKIKLPDSLPLPGTTENFPFFFVADEAFPLCSYIMRPFPGNRLSEAQKIFNYRLSTARRLIENTFGILVQRFRIFRTEILAQPEKVKAIIIASICLHNFIISTRGAPTDIQELSIGSGISQLGRVGSNNSSRTNQDLRNRLMDYFLSVEGAVPWQQEKALRGTL
ncbi:uncharacterized protein LOC136027974 [Artemia franciscana]|uniref:uncharacterized protein LOC136027974 n=1 Tax=Artemia franciscana TaxID=6661 RepID=UPI0032DB3174